MVKIVCLGLFGILLALTSLGQTTDKATVTAFDYHRDFKAILEQTQADTSKLYYDSLLVRFLQNDTSLSKAETLALMIGFTENQHYQPLEDMEKEEEIFEHNKSSEFHEAVDKGRPYLDTHPLSLLVLREVSFAYSRLGLYYGKNGQFDSAIICQDSAKYFMDLNDKVMEAMIYSGKGRSPQTAIFSLGLADGEYFIPNVGYTIEKKTADWIQKKDFMEIIQATNERGESIIYFFAIQHAKAKIDDDKADAMAIKKKNKKSVKKKSKQQAKPSSKTAEVETPVSAIPTATPDSITPAIQP